MLEALSGLPVDVAFMSFDDVLTHGIPADTKVIINAGWQGSAWSGGDYWKNSDLIAKLTQFVAEGGGLIGVNEPSACDAHGTYFQLSHIFGVDRDLGSKKCIGKYQYSVEENSFVMEDTKNIGDTMKVVEGVYVLNKDVKVLAENDGTPVITMNHFGKGCAMYLSSFRFSLESTRFLMRAICQVSQNTEAMEQYICDNLNTECAYYPAIDKLVVINNTGEVQKAVIKTEKGNVEVTLEPFVTHIQ